MKLKSLFVIAGILSLIGFSSAEETKKAKKEIADGVEEIMKNGRKAMKGKCPTCGTVMFKILGGKAAAPAAPTNSTPPA